MYSLTQGTIITGIRSDKYPNIRCNGVVISARCDLANCKISKIYYLVAVPSDDWLLSDEGFNIVLSQRQNELEDKLQAKLGGSGLDWSTLKSFSVEDFSTVIHDQEVGLKKDTEKANHIFCLHKDSTPFYKQYWLFLIFYSLIPVFIYSCSVLPAFYLSRSSSGSRWNFLQYLRSLTPIGRSLISCSDRVPIRSTTAA